MRQGDMDSEQLRFKAKLNARMSELHMDVRDVTAELNRRGVAVAYSTVAGWFNENRGKRWDVTELAALLAVLKTDLRTLLDPDSLNSP